MESVMSKRANGKEPPSQQLVQHLFDYNKSTGIFCWKNPRSNRVKKGAKAGSFCGNGYLYIGIGKERYTAQHLAWVYVHGTWPSGVLDHINKITTDNRICNLRITTKRGNALNNKAKERKDYGVYYHNTTGKWRVQLYKNSKHHYFGLFDSYKKAMIVAQEARGKLGV